MKRFLTTLAAFSVLFWCAAQPIPTAYYKMDDSGNPVVDQVSANNGTGSSVGFEVSGKISSAISFDGTSSGVTLPDASQLYFYNQSFTVWCWVYADTHGSSWRGILGGYTGAFVMGTYGSSGYIQIAKQGTAGSSQSTLSISTGAWHFVAISFNSSATTDNVTLYVDNNSTTFTFNYDFDNLVATKFIGKLGETSNYFDGSIDEVGMLKGTACNATQIDQLYNGGAARTYPYPAATGKKKHLNRVIAYRVSYGNSTITTEEPATFAGNLASNQNFETYSAAVNGDYVGQIRINPAWDTIGTPTYAITEDASGLFAVNSSGMIYMPSVTGLTSAATYPIKYKITDGDYSEEANGSIYVVPNSEVIKVTNWATYSGAFTAGRHYLQQRGTTINTSSVVTINANNVTIGAYGQGAYPVVYMNQNVDERTFECDGYTGLTIRDLQVQNYKYDAWRIMNFANAADKYTTVDNCVLTKCKWPSWYYGIRLRILNCDIHHVLDDGIHIEAVDNIEIANTAIYDVNRGRNDAGVLVTSSPYYGDGIQIEPRSSSYSDNSAYIHDFYISKNDTNKQAICYGSYGGTGNLLVENGRIHGSANAGKIVKAFYLSSESGYRQDTVIFRRVEFANFNLGFLHGSSSGGSRRTEVSYCTFKNMNGGFDFYGLTDSLIFNNNSIYDVGAGEVFYLSNSNAKLKLRNNIIYLTSDIDIKNTTGSSTSDYNIYYPNATARNITLGSHDIEGDPEWESLSALRLATGSPAINAGKRIGFTTDLFGNAITGSPDIGAYEK